MKTSKILNNELPDSVRDEQVVSVGLAPMRRLPSGLPAIWRKVLASEDPVDCALEQIWQPWQHRLPGTIDALGRTLRGIALLQTREMTPSLLYVFEAEGERYFRRGFRCRPISNGDSCFSAEELKARLPPDFLELYNIHDGWPSADGCGLMPSAQWLDLSAIFDEDELKGGERDTPPLDFLVVSDVDSRYIGFDMTPKEPRCLSWHPREDLEVVEDVVALLDQEQAQALEEFEAS